MKRGLALIASAALVFAGCSAGGDTSIYVTNDSEHVWYVKVLRNPEWDRASAYWVVRVEPGANAFAVSWFGGRTVPVTVLNPDCSVVGQFVLRADGLYGVEGAPGLTGRIEDHGAPLGSRTTTPGVADIEECGGFVGR